MRNVLRRARGGLAALAAARVAARVAARAAGLAAAVAAPLAVGLGAGLAAGLAATLLGACAARTGADGPLPAEGCTVDVIVQFAPYVAAPSSQAFAAELVQGSGYHLRYVRSLGTSHVLRLTGPDTTCDAGLAHLRREPRIESLDIDERQFRHTVRSPEAR